MLSLYFGGPAQLEEIMANAQLNPEQIQSILELQRQEQEQLALA